MSDSILCDYKVGLNKKLNTINYSATFNALAYTGPEVNKLAKYMYISPYLYRNEINCICNLYKLKDNIL